LVILGCPSPVFSASTCRGTAGIHPAMGENMLPYLCCCRRDNELIRGRAALLPVISSKDWRDIDWAISAQVWTSDD
jgi:hypothetical protein